MHIKACFFLNLGTDLCLLLQNLFFPHWSEFILYVYLKLSNCDGVFSLLRSLTSWTSRRDGCPNWTTMERYSRPRRPVSVFPVAFREVGVCLKWKKYCYKRKLGPRRNTVSLRWNLALLNLPFPCSGRNTGLFCLMLDLSITETPVQRR